MIALGERERKLGFVLLAQCPIAFHVIERHSNLDLICRSFGLNAFGKVHVQ